MEVFVVLGGFGHEKTNPIKLVLSGVEWTQFMFYRRERRVRGAFK